MIKLDLDRIAKILKVDTVSDYQDTLSDSGDTWGYVRDQALREGGTEDEAEEAASKAEQEEQDEYCGKYIDGLVLVFEIELEKIGLDLKPLKKKGQEHAWEYLVGPKKTWRDAAEEIRQAVYGISGWDFGSLKGFLDSGPYTPQTAVDEHLGYVGRLAELYGDTSPKQRLANYLR